MCREARSSLVAVGIREGVEVDRDSLAPFTELRQLVVGHSEKVPEHGHRNWPREFRDDVDIGTRLKSLEERPYSSADDLLNPTSGSGQRTGFERGGSRSSETGVLESIGIEHGGG
jgi:hypothetical protein